MPDLSDSVVVVTGARQGIGWAVACAFLEAGAAVAFADLRFDASFKDDVTGLARDRALACQVDVSDADSVAALAETVQDELGAIDIWVNNAGISRPAMLHNMEVDSFDAVMAVHARGTFLGVREAARQMIEGDRGGCILNVTSSAGLDGTIGQINYAAAKGAIAAMTKSAARELARRGIRVNAVAPVAATEMTETIRTDPELADKYLARIPLRRFADPEEVARTFVFLASPASSYTTGQIVCVDGGLHMAS